MRMIFAATAIVLTISATVAQAGSSYKASLCKASLCKASI